MTASIGRYLVATRWIVRRAVRSGGTPLIGSVIATLASFVATLVALGLIVSLLRGLENDTDIELAIRGFDLGSIRSPSLGLVLIIAVFVLSAVLQYIGEVAGLTTCRRLLHDLRRDLAKAAASEHADPILAATTYPSVATVVQVTSREIGMAAIQVVRVPAAIITTLLAGIVLAVLSPLMTALLAIAIPLYLVGVSRLNRKARVVHQEQHRLTAEASREVTGWLGKAEITATEDLSNEPAIPATDRVDSILFDRLVVVRQIGLANGLMLALMLGMVMGVLVWRGDDAPLDLAIGLAFIALLRFAIASLRQVSVATNMISRFMGSTATAMRLIDGIDPTPNDVSDAPQGQVSPATEQRSCYAIITNRMNRVGALQGCLILSKHDHRVAPGSIELRLDEAPPMPGNAVARNVSHLLPSQIDAPPADEVTVILARNRAVVDRLVRIGLEPTRAVDLRQNAPLVVPWSQIVDDVDDAATPGQGDTYDTSIIDSLLE